MDLTPLILDANREIAPFVEMHIQRFHNEIVDRLKRIS
jgi:hypothetical protein